MTTDEQHLKDFMSSYFHQDWALDAEGPGDVVAQFFADQNSPERLVSIARALRSVVSQKDDDDTLSARLFKEFGSYFDPRGIGQSTRAWLLAVADDFEAEAKRRG